MIYNVTVHMLVRSPDNAKGVKERVELLLDLNADDQMNVKERKVVVIEDSSAKEQRAHTEGYDRGYERGRADALNGVTPPRRKKK